MKINKLKDLLKKFESNIIYNADLKKKIGLILEARQKFFIKHMS